jgi:polar amino acid transport system permease protein
LPKAVNLLYIDGRIMGNNYNWDFNSILINWDVFAHGLVVTAQLSALTLATGLGLGFFLGLARYSRHQIFRLPSSIFVEIFRNVPALVVVIWFFFAFPIVSPFEVDAFTAAFLAISANTAAFSADIYRGGIQSISPHQWEAGRALGMSYLTIMRRIIFPQAIKRIIPPLTGRGIEAIKLSTLASVIAVNELLYAAKQLSALNFNPIEAYTTVAFLFFIIIYPLTHISYFLERRFGLSD